MQRVQHGIWWPVVGLLVVSGILVGCEREGGQAPGGGVKPSGSASATAFDGAVFELAFARRVRETPFTGRVFLVLAPNDEVEPRRQVSCFQACPFFAHDVADWAPESPLRLHAGNVLGYPAPLHELPKGRVFAQAVLSQNDWARDVINAASNGVSEVVELDFDPDATEIHRLPIRQLIPPSRILQFGPLRVVSYRSALLSSFHGREVALQAAVALPPGAFEETSRKFPAVYVIPGFDGSIEDYQQALRYRYLFDGLGFDAVVVLLDPSFPSGHHACADSANNGPVATALRTEFIPALEGDFPLLSDPDARFLMGASSGGWASLWLQVQYPDFFGGTWSCCPDPVDFRCMLNVDIYATGANMLYASDGARRRVSRPGGLLDGMTLGEFVRLETVLGRGGQLYAFDAVFSPRARDGRPQFLWHRETGVIDPQIADAWRRYDIRLYLEQHWSTVGSKLAGKLHVICGAQDDFYLDRPVLLLRKALVELGSDAEVTLIPDATHSLPERVWRRIVVDIRDHFRATQLAREPAAP